VGYGFPEVNGVYPQNYSVDLYEVKSFRDERLEKKAKKQLDKAKAYFEDLGYKVNKTYLFFGESQELFIVNGHEDSTS